MHKMRMNKKKADSYRRSLQADLYRRVTYILVYAYVLEQLLIVSPFTFKRILLKLDNTMVTFLGQKKSGCC